MSNKQDSIKIKTVRYKISVCLVFLMLIFTPLSAQYASDQKLDLLEKDQYHFNDQDGLFISNKVFFKSYNTAFLAGLGESFAGSVLVSATVGGVATLFTDDKKETFTKWSVGALVFSFPLSSIGRISSIEKKVFVNYNDKWIEPSSADLVKIDNYWIVDKTKNENAWELAKSLNNKDAYDLYLKSFPLGAHANEARFQSQFLLHLTENKNDTLSALHSVFSKAKLDTIKYMTITELSSKGVNGFNTILKLYNETYHYDPSTANNFILYDIGNWDRPEDRAIIITAINSNTQSINESIYAQLGEELSLNRTEYNHYTVEFMVNLLSDANRDYSINKLTKLLKDENNKYVIIAIIKSLGKLKALEASQIIREKCHDKNLEIRAESIYNLAQIESDNALDILKIAANDKKETIRNSVNNSLVFLTNSDNVNELKEILAENEN